MPATKPILKAFDVLKLMFYSVTPLCHEVSMERYKIPGPFRQAQ